MEYKTIRIEAFKPPVLTTGPEFTSSVDPGCRPGMMRGMMKMKKGTVTNAMMLYTAESDARFSSTSIA